MLCCYLALIPAGLVLGCWLGSKLEFHRSYPLICVLLALAALNVGLLASADTIKLVASAVFAFTYGSAAWCLYPLIVDPAGYRRLRAQGRKRR